MPRYKNPTDTPRTTARLKMIGVRVDAEQKQLIEQAADREGLQVSSFIIMLLVRLRILPDTCTKNLKRSPAPFFRDLHALSGTVNRIGGNFKQLSAALPNHTALRPAHASLLHASDAIADALHGKKIPKSTDLQKLDNNLTLIGFSLNDIARSVNAGKPELANLPAVLAAITKASNAIIIALTGNPAPTITAPPSARPAPDRYALLKEAAKWQTKPRKGER